MLSEFPMEKDEQAASIFDFLLCLITASENTNGVNNLVWSLVGKSSNPLITDIPGLIYNVDKKVTYNSWLNITLIF